ncbi:hypothetical protein E4U60_005967 [Claviceps pazoutovae]|uniref:Calcofluor white hypersensitive protein n=1 Tax=Claviceps pazoutovae TaxID=1649127 RepID=A0A9P7MG22_9HYPO|nr:hypothetical protein E4U61_002800 [Claviceps capensis]KAG5944449.1 hypothetical protein E4U60_005967 [Claviceps pazoutovae]
MSKSRMPLVLGLGAAGGIGYYLYSAGGSPKAAENKFESDVHRASAKVKNAMPGSKPGLEKDLKDFGAETGAKIDKVWAEADKKAGTLKSETEAYVKDTKSEAIKAVDKFDKTVEDGASKAKSGISSWFGGSK